MGKIKTAGIVTAAFVAGAESQTLNLSIDNPEKLRLDKLISLNKGIKEIVDIKVEDGTSKTYAFEYVGSRTVEGSGQYEVKINGRRYFFGDLDAKFLLEYDGEGRAPTISLDRTIRTGEEINTTLVLYLENATANLPEVKNP